MHKHQKRNRSKLFASLQSLEPRKLYSTSPADFEGTAAYDSVPGAGSGAGGWSTPWTTVTKDGNNTTTGTMQATVDFGGNPQLNSSTHYMSGTWTGGAGGSFKAGTIYRNYAAGTTATAAHEIQFDYVYAVPSGSAFTTSNDGVSIFGGTTANYVTSSGDTWEVFTNGAQTNPTWKFANGLYDNPNDPNDYNPNNFLETNFPAVAGHAYRFNLFVYPGNSNYLGEITDKTTGQHFEAHDRLGFRNVADGPHPSNTPSALISFGTRVSATSEILKFHADQVSVGLIPTTPRVVAAPQSPTSVKVDWYPNGGANVDHYILERSTDGNFNSNITVFPTSYPAGNSSYSVTDNSLSASSRYFYRVTAYSLFAATTLGQSSVHGLSGNVNTPAAGLTVPFLHIQTVSSTQMNLIWPDANGATSYSVEYSKTNSFSTVDGSFTTGADSNTRTIDGLSQNTQYWFRIKSTDGNTWSGYTISSAWTSSGQVSTWVVAAPGSNDSQSIQDAITHAPDGSIITFPSGTNTYVLSSTIQIPAGKHLTFQGSTSISSSGGTTSVVDRTIIDSHLANGGHAFQFSDTTPVGSDRIFNGAVTGLTFIGGNGVYFNNSNNTAISGAVIDGCHFVDSAGDGISSDNNGLVDTVIQDNVFDDTNGFGIYGQSQSKDNVEWQFLHITNNLFQGSGPAVHIGGDAKDSWNSKYLVLEQNHVVGCAWKGYELQGAGAFAILQDNYFDSPDLSSTAPHPNHDDRLAMTVPLDGVDQTVIRRNKIVVPDQSSEVNLLLELGGHNIRVYDNYLRGGVTAIAVNGGNPTTTGSIHDNQLVQYVNDITYNGDNTPALVSTNNNTAATILDWNIGRNVPGPFSRLLI